MVDPVKVARRTLEVAGLNFSYRDSGGDGDSDGPTIFCIHGRFGRGETWMPLVNRYRGKYRVIAPDLRGHGLSAKPIGRYTSQEMAADMAGLILSGGFEKPIVVGHSTGGRVAGYLAATFPDRVGALAILDQSAASPKPPSTLALDQIPQTDSFTRDWPLPFSSLEQAKTFLLELTGSAIRTEYYLDSLIETESGYDVLFSRQATSAIFEYQEDWFHLLPKIECPVMLLKAKESSHVSPSDWERMQKEIPTAYPFEVQKPDHHVYRSDPEEFYSCFDRFLEQL